MPSKPAINKRSYVNGEVLPFDGTLQGLADQLDLLKCTMPRGPALVEDGCGNILNRLRVKSKRLSDGSYVWDVELFQGQK